MNAQQLQPTLIETLPPVVLESGALAAKDQNALFRGALCGVLGVGVKRASLVERYGSIYLINVTPVSSRDPLIPIPAVMSHEMAARYKQAMSFTLGQQGTWQEQTKMLDDFLDWFVDCVRDYTVNEANYFVLYLRRWQNEIYCQYERPVLQNYESGY